MVVPHAILPDLNTLDAESLRALLVETHEFNIYHETALPLSGSECFMYIVSAVLLFPACVLLWLAWSHRIKSGQVATESRWREYSMAASLIAASCATLTEIGFVVSWFHNGGSPHGMEPSPGLWKTLGPIFRGTLLASVALAILGKGKPRIYVLGWTAAILVAIVLIFVLEMD